MTRSEELLANVFGLSIPLVLVVLPGWLVWLATVRWGVRAGLAGVVLGDLWGNGWVVVGAMGLNGCLDGDGCPREFTQTWVDHVVTFLQVGLEVWPLHLVWLAIGLGCVGLGYRKRRRRSLTAAAQGPRPGDRAR
jgi:hypothetical protein